MNWRRPASSDSDDLLVPSELLRHMDGERESVDTKLLWPSVERCTYLPAIWSSTKECKEQESIITKQWSYYRQKQKRNGCRRSSQCGKEKEMMWAEQGDQRIVTFRSSMIRRKYACEPSSSTPGPLPRRISSQIRLANALHASKIFWSVGSGRILLAASNYW
jgi:hypothetical protein